MAMVRLDSISKHYGPVVALTGIDISIAEGEFLTLLGPSGSGKTTLLNLIAGTIAPTTGGIWLDGKDVTRLPPSRRELGMVFQSYALFPHMTVFENVAFPLQVRRVGAAEINRKVAAALDMVQLPNIAKRKPTELSGGQQQRVAIARCLVYNPRLILMDEPLGALDKKLREQMQLEIKRLHRQLGMTVLYVTHDQEEALVLSDRICLMHGGRIAQLGTPDELYFHPTSVFAADFLGESNIIEAEVIADVGGVRLRSSNGLTLTTLERRASAPGGSLVSVVIRPERVQVLTDGVTAGVMADGTIEDVVFGGGTSKLFVRTSDGGRLLVRHVTTQRAPAFVRGESVRLGWESADVVVLPQDPGQPDQGA